MTSLCLYQNFYNLSFKCLFFLTSLILVTPEGNFFSWPWYVFCWGHHCWKRLSPLCSVGPSLSWDSGCYWCRGLVICPGWYAKKQFPFLKFKGSWNIFTFKMWNTVDQLIGDIIFVRNRFSFHEDLKFSRMWEYFIFKGHLSFSACPFYSLKPFKILTVYFLLHLCCRLPRFITEKKGSCYQLRLRICISFCFQGEQVLLAFEAHISSLSCWIHFKRVQSFKKIFIKFQLICWSWTAKYFDQFLLSSVIQGKLRY